MSSGNGPGDGNNTDMRRPASPDLYGGSPKKEHKDGVSDAKKRKIEDTEDGEAHEEACLFSAKRDRLQVDVKQGSAQPEQKGASSKEKDNTQEQGVDEMDIDDNKKEGGLDSELMEATKKMGIKPPDEVKNDMDWAEIYSHTYWPASGTSGSRK